MVFISMARDDQDGPNTRQNERRIILRLVALALIANLGSVSPGMTLGFSAVALPQMKNPNATFTINDDQASWMASTASLATAAGALMSGPIMDRFGRRTALLTVNVPCLLGWLLIAFAEGPATLALIYAGRFFTGLATGLASAPPAVYSAEVSTEKMRGMLVTWTAMSISLGILLIYILGTFIPNWRLVAGVSAIFPTISFILMFLILPESPVWLKNKGRTEESNAVLLRIHGSTEVAKLEKKTPLPRDTRTLKNILLSPSFIKPFIIMNSFFFFQQFSGTFVIVFYAVDIVKEAGVSFDPYIIAILIAATRFIVTFAVSFISNRFGRRPPSIVSGAGMTLCMGCLATFLYLESTKGISKTTAESMSWFPVVCLILYILTSTIGFLTLPWAMVGELYPSRVRGIAAGLTTFSAYFMNFIIVKIYPLMLTSLQRYGLFFFYGGISVLGTIFVVLFLPETKGRDLAEIEQYFMGKKKVLEGDEEQPLQQIPNKVTITPKAK